MKVSIFGTVDSYYWYYFYKWLKGYIDCELNRSQRMLDLAVDRNHIDGKPDRSCSRGQQLTNDQESTASKVNRIPMAQEIQHSRPMTGMIIAISRSSSFQGNNSLVSKKEKKRQTIRKIHQAVTKGLTSSSKFSGYNVLTLQTIPIPHETIDGMFPMLNPSSTKN